VTQAPTADGELGELGDLVVPADDAAPGALWLPHAVITSPHATMASTPEVTVRSPTAALMSLR
jgi:hypothetical protein